MHLEQLFQNVYENPADDRRRLVLADALLERGDVRGELIVLQFQTHALARKRARKLIGRHRSHFLGPLSEVVLHGSDEWEKGFLVGCAARLSSGAGACSAWATVRRLTVVSRCPPQVEELQSMCLRSLREVHVQWEPENWWNRL